MRHRRLFDELRDMQAETNAFFDEVHDRLSRLSAALDGWRTQSDRAEHSVLPNPHGYERIEQHRTPTLRSGQAPMMSGAVITERYERRIYFPDPENRCAMYASLRVPARAHTAKALRPEAQSGSC